MKKIWLKIKGFALLLFGNAKKVEQFIETHVDDAVNIVETIKDLVNRPVVITLLTAFPGKFATLAAKVIDKIKLHLEAVLDGLEIGKTCFAAGTFVEKLDCVVKGLRGLTEDQRNQIYKEIAVNYARARSVEMTKKKEQIPVSLAEKFVQDKYLEIKYTKLGVKAAKDE